jgi:hypothetical protein
MPILEQVYWLITLSIVVAAVAWTVTQKEIFREPREYCQEKSETCKSIFERKFFYIFTCEYCFSFWVTLFFLLLTGFQLIIDDFRGYILVFFAIPWLANHLMSIYRRLRVGIKYENLQAKVVEEELEEK